MVRRVKLMGFRYRYYLYCRHVFELLCSWPAYFSAAVFQQFEKNTISCIQLGFWNWSCFQISKMFLDYFSIYAHLKCSFPQNYLLINACDFSNGFFLNFLNNVCCAFSITVNTRAIRVLFYFSNWNCNLRMHLALS